MSSQLLSVHLTRLRLARQGHCPQKRTVVPTACCEKAARWKCSHCIHLQRIRLKKMRVATRAHRLCVCSQATQRLVRYMQGIWFAVTFARFSAVVIGLVEISKHNNLVVVVQKHLG